MYLTVEKIRAEAEAVCWNGNVFDERMWTSGEDKAEIATERVHVLSTRFGPAGITSSTSLPDVCPMGNNNTSNNKQQIMSAWPSQPSIAGFGNNQPVHPHMPFIPRQQMFGLGPRLPVGGMKQYTSTSNAMFNTSGNAQPTLNHQMLRPVSGTTSGLGWKRELNMSREFYDSIPSIDYFLHWKWKGRKLFKSAMKYIWLALFQVLIYVEVIRGSSCKACNYTGKKDRN